MARLKQYARSIFSSYASIGVSVVYSLTSIPLILHYLPKEQFGLWAVVSQIVGYIGLVDFGIAGAASRLLIDHKDKKSTGIYGSLIKTGFLVNLIQGTLILLGGWCLVNLLALFFDLQATNQSEIRILFLGQVVLLAIGFACRVTGAVLIAHQRFDLINFAGISLFIANLAVLWFCLQQNMGILSMLWAQAAGVIATNGLSIFFCLYLNLFPQADEWGRISRDRFWEMFNLGRDVFFYLVGNQLINASQAILCTKMMGLEIAAIWSVCTRTFQLVSQGMYQIFETSSPAFAEMMVRNERERLLDRFRSLVTFSASLTLVLSVFFALFNQSFVSLWTAGKIAWPKVNDLLLGGWLFLLVLIRNHMGLASQTKDFKMLRWISLLEGIFFVTLSFVFMRYGGITAMLCVSIIASLCFSFPFGIWRTSRYFNTSFEEVFSWLKLPMRMGIFLIPFVAAFWWFTRELSHQKQLFFGCLSIIPVGLVLFFRLGMEEKLRRELIQRFFK